MNPNKIKNFLNLDPKDHYRIFIENAYRNDGVWVLENDEDTYAININNTPTVLMWHDENFALYYKETHEINDMSVEFVDIDELIEDFVPSYIDLKLNLFINPIPNKEGLLILPQRLLSDLEDRIDMEE